MPPWLRRAAPLAALLFGALVFVGVVHSQTKPENPAGGPENAVDPQADFREIAGLFYSGQFEAVITKTTEFQAKHALSEATFPVLFFQAESQSQLGRTDDAIQSYQRALPFIHQLHNVNQRRFVFAFFRLGSLYREKRQYDAAIRHLQAGLTREPQNFHYQILLGEVLKEQGHRDQAVKHFKELLESASANPEERIVVRVKLNRLLARTEPAPRLQLAGQPFHSNLKIGIVPLNGVDSGVSLPDVCLLLESKWLVACEVLPALVIDEGLILDPRRQQYDGDKLLNEVWRRYPANQRAHQYVVGVTGQDIFGEGTNFVFSWQSRQEGVGVLSMYRFVTGLEDFYERPIVGTRRVGIQFLSTTGSLLGFSRPPKAECPMAYPHDLGEFLLKGSRLCEVTIQERDTLLKTKGGTPTRFGAKKIDEINRVYRSYYFD